MSISVIVFFHMFFWDLVLIQPFLATQQLRELGRASLVHRVSIMEDRGLVLGDGSEIPTTVWKCIIKHVVNDGISTIASSTGE